MSDLPVETIAPPPSASEPTPAEAMIEEMVRMHYGLSGHAEPIDGIPGAFAIDSGHMRYRVDIRDAQNIADLRLEAAVLRHLAQKADTPDAPEPVTTRDGQDIVLPDQDGGVGLRIATLRDGVPLPSDRALNDEERAGMGRVAGELAKSLADFDAPGLERRVDADLRHAGPAVLQLLSDVTDHAVRDPIAKVLVAALRRMQPLGQMLRVQPVHHELTGEAVTGRWDEDGTWHATGVSNVDAVARGWLAASLAVTCADLIARGSSDPFDILPAVCAFNDVHPLTEPELRVLWPLIVARASVLAAQAEQTTAAANADGEGTTEAEMGDNSRRKVFAVATGVHPALMEAAILDATGFDVGGPALNEQEICRLLPQVDTERIRLVDLGVDSPLLADGNWTDPEIDWRMLARVAWDTHMAATRYGEYRLSRSLGPSNAENHALHVDICVPAGTVVVAPFGGILKEVGQQLILVGRDATLYLEGLVCPLSEGMALFAEDAIGSVAGSEGSVGGLRIRLCREADLVPPLFTNAARAGAWRRLCPSPSHLLGIDVDAPAPKTDDLVRGWRAHVYDGSGRRFTDFSGGAGIVGHAHPALAQAAYGQWSLLSGFLGAAPLRKFHAALLVTLPQGLDVIAATGTEDEMAELARTLADRGDRLQPMPNLGDHAQEDGAPKLRVADERRSGFGRNGLHFWQFEADGITPDIVITGSILPGRPLAVVAVRSELVERISHLQPARIDAVDAAVALAALGALRDEALLAAAHMASEVLRAGLEALAADRDALIDGRGLALDIVLPQPWARTLSRLLRQRGFLTAAVDDPRRLAVRAPLCLDAADAENFVHALADCWDTMRNSSENVSVIARDNIVAADGLPNPGRLPI